LDVQQTEESVVRYAEPGLLQISRVPVQNLRRDRQYPVMVISSL